MRLVEVDAPPGLTLDAVVFRFRTRADLVTYR